jgi:Tfp pilus assembly protein FimV
MAATITPLQLDRPHLRVLDGGRAPSRRAVAARYRRRRLVVAVALLAALCGGLVLANAAVASTAGGGHHLPAAGAVSVAGAPATYVVQPGDTLWSIAAATAPGLDVRLAVDRLVERNGRAPLVVGQVLELPSPRS